MSNQTCHNLTSSTAVKPIGHLRGYLFFLAITGTILSFCWLGESYVAWFFLAVWLMRLWLTRQLLLISSCLFVSIGLSFIFHQQQQEQIFGEKLPHQEVSHIEVIIEGDDSEVSTEGLHFSGEIKQTGEKIMGHYFFENDKQKKVPDLATLPGKRLSLIVSGLLKPVPVKRNLGSFDYRRYLKQQGVFRQLTINRLDKVTKISVTSPIPWLKSCRGYFFQVIDHSFPETLGSYIKGLLLGKRDKVFKERQRDFTKLGILHFFSLSGLHVYFFLGMFTKLLIRCRLTQKPIFVSSLLFLGGFAILTGFSTSVGRSVFYIALVLINRHFSWQYTLLDCWAVCLLINLCLTPYLLFTPAGQLSFGLTLGIILINPLIDSWVTPKLKTVAFGFLVTLISVPIVSFHFYEWQLSALMLSVILVPLFSYILLPGVLVFFLGNYLIDLTFISSQVERGILLMEKYLFQLNELRWIHVTTGKIPLVIYLASLVCLLAWVMVGEKTRKFSTMWLLCSMSLPTLFKYVNPTGYVAFVDVGQGDALVIKQPFNRGTILVDTGGKIIFENKKNGHADKPLAHYGLLPFLKYLGVSQLEQVFITHGHVDHYGDLLTVAKEIPVKSVVYPEGTTVDPGFQQTVSGLKGLRVSTQTVLAGKHWQFPDVKLTSLYPITPGKGGNDDSLVLKMKIKEQTLLLMGDLEEAGEKELVKQGWDLTADILSVGHHGSKTSTHPFLVEKVRPQEAIISCGVNNRFNHPNQEVLEILEASQTTIYRTDQEGMIYYTWTPLSKGLTKGPQLIAK